MDLPNIVDNFYDSRPIQGGDIIEKPANLAHRLDKEFQPPKVCFKVSRSGSEHQIWKDEGSFEGSGYLYILENFCDTRPILRGDITEKLANFVH